MKKIRHYLYNIIFWLSRFFTIYIFGICLCFVLHTKYILPKFFSHLLISFIETIDENSNFIVNLLCILNTDGCLFYDFKIDVFGLFCKNSQWIDLLLIAFVVILILNIIIVKFINKKYRYLLTIGIISSTVYIVMYSIFKLPIMLALTISTPIILLIIYFLNAICPLQKIMMLIPIIGEILCTKQITNHIFKKATNNTLNFSLLLISLILSNIFCFFFPYKTDKDFENRIMDNWTYSIRTYQDKMIISGDKELIVVNKNGNNTHFRDDKFVLVENFIIDNTRQKIYFCNFDDDKLLILDLLTFNIISEINIVERKFEPTRLCCNNDFSKLIIIFESLDIGYLIDLNSHYNIEHINKLSTPRDGLIYNKYRNCFLVSFHEENNFLQEIDIENKKTRKIKADKYQGYLAISERNKEIYVAFHQQGKIGVYDAQTMKLKRKIKSNYTVKNITYDEELNILIAPSYFTGYVDIFLMDGSDKLLTREFVGYDLREGCFDPQKENLYVCSQNGLYKKRIYIRELVEKT